MQLYFSPLACSASTRIALYEAGADAAYVEVDPYTKRTKDDRDYREIHPLGLVPALRLTSGELLTENAAILQYVARRFPAAQLAPALEDAVGQAQLQQWLCFIGTELHRGMFTTLLDRKAPDAVKAYVLAKGTSRLTYVSSHLADRPFLLDRFSVADAYLVTVLNWTQAVVMDEAGNRGLGGWPVLAAYAARVRERPSVARALQEELALYVAEMARHPAS